MKEYQEIFSYKLDASDKRMVEHNLTYKSKETLIQEYLKEITLFTNPYLQTIHFRYRWIISCLVYLGCPVTPIIDIHKDNIEYEKLHPPVIYSKEKKKSVRTKKVKEEKVTKAKPKKGTVYLTKLSSNKTLTLSREAAEGIVRDYPNEYKITEIE